MGTTLTALQAGSVACQLVAAIEGYEHLITNGPAAAAVTAWAGTDWTTAIGGLYLTGFNEQQIDPWDPIRNAGRMSLQVLATPQDGDVFGVATAKKVADAETFLRATADRDDTTLTVASTNDFASAGTAYVGTECFAYSGITATTFTGCVRGVFSPFLRQGGGRFGQHHRVGEDPNTVVLEPLVTQVPRVWAGKWVGVWMHRVVAGVLDVKAQAQLIFAGRIVATYDDAQTGATIVELKHVLDYIKEQVLGRDIWHARCPAGVFLEEGMTFAMEDFSGTAPVKTADELTVVASGATPPNEINEGYYTLHDLNTAVNSWLANEKSATRISGIYSMTQTTPPGGADLRTRIHWRIPGAGPEVLWGLSMPRRVGVLLGFDDQDFTVNAVTTIHGRGRDDKNYDLYSKFEPKKTILNDFQTDSIQFEVSSEQGVFWDNTSLLSIQHPASPATGWGVFLLDERYLIVGSKSGTTLSSCFSPDQFHVGTDVELIDKKFSIPLSSDQPASMSIRQLYWLEDTFANIFSYLCLSTGITDHNATGYDLLPYGLGLALPYDLASGILSTAPGAALAGAPLLLIIDEPTKFVDLVHGDLLLRRAFFRFLNGTVELGSWKTPTASGTVATLGESTKAAPSTQRESHRCASAEQGHWARPVIQIDYDRKILSKDKGGYTATYLIEDKTAIDDQGGEAAAFVIRARNVYAEHNHTGAALEELVKVFVASAALFTRAANLVRRSIGSAYFEGLTVGDLVLVTDTFARDPETGERGITERPALVVRHRCQWGGRQAGAAQPSPAGGEVDLFLLPLNRIAAYVPCAQVDDTANTGGFSAGYNSGTNTLRCYAHKHSENSEAVDASHFAATYKIRIVEIDPAASGSPTTWDRTISSVSGNDIVLTAALSSPAWDAAKKYRIIFDTYGDSITAQKVKCFQADDADAKIEDVRPPYEYAYGQASATYTANAGSDPVELPPDLAAGDGAALDVGHQVALIRVLENFLDYKGAVSSPYLHNSEMSGAAVTGTWLLVEMSSIFLTQEILSQNLSRALYVAPHFKSSDGASASVRVSLCRFPPTGSSRDDVDRGVLYSETTFTTTSTSHATPTAQPLDIFPMKDANGIAWLLIELTVKARTWGLGFCQEGPRG